jgi:hypothetical protein
LWNLPSGTTPECYDSGGPPGARFVESSGELATREQSLFYLDAAGALREALNAA